MFATVFWLVLEQAACGWFLYGFMGFCGFSLGGPGLLSCAPLSHYFGGSFFEYIHLIKKKKYFG